MNLDMKLIVEEMKRFQDRSMLEAEVIAKGMDGNTRIYVDLGCWAGTLAKDVLEATGAKGYLVDGCRDLLDIADYLCGACRLDYKVMQAIIVPEKWTGSRYLQVPTHSTGSGSLIHKDRYNTTSCLFASHATIHVKDIGTFLGIDFNEAFVKVDLEGVDILVIQDMLKANIEPRGLHFEVKNQDYYDTLKPFLVNYPYPDKLPEGHEFWSVSMVKDETRRSTSTIIGMNPDKVYENVRT